MSDLSVQQIQPVQVYNPQFNGDQKVAVSGVPYYESNEGFKTGALLSLPAVVDFLPDLRLKDKDYFEKTVKDYADCVANTNSYIDKKLQAEGTSSAYSNILRKVKGSIPDAEAYRKTCARKYKLAIPATIIATGCTMGAGMLVDSVRNEKAKEVAEQAVLNQAELQNNPNVAYGVSGTPYYVSKTGRRLGGILGSAFGVLSAYLNGGMAKSAPNVGLRAFLFGLGGLGVGAIYDRTVNKKSERVVNYLA